MYLVNLVRRNAAGRLRAQRFQSAGARVHPTSMLDALPNPPDRLKALKGRRTGKDLDPRLHHRAILVYILVRYEDASRANAPIVMRDWLGFLEVSEAFLTTPKRVHVSD